MTIPEVAKEEIPLEAVTLEDDIPPLWPDEAAENAYLTEERARGTIVPGPIIVATEEVTDCSQPLPKLDDLVQRIPPAVRWALEENFRAKFSKVIRVPRSAMPEKR